MNNSEKNIKFLRNSLDCLIYIVEFIFSICLMINVINIITEIKYESCYLYKNICLSFFLGISILGCILYFNIRFKDKIEKIFLTYAIPLCLAFTFFILPFNVPDEGAHIVRAYSISLGHFSSIQDENGNWCSETIKELEEDSHERIKSYNDLKNEISKKTDYEAKIKKISSAQGYSPLIYLGSAFGFAVGRLLKLNIFIAIYIARCINVIVFLMFGYFSIKKIPFAKTILAIWLCIPMMMQQVASCSSDSIINSILVFYIANLFYVCFKKEINLKDRIKLYILTALIAVFKYIYLLMAGILIIKIFKEKSNRKKTIIMFLTMIVIGTTAVIITMIQNNNNNNNNSSTPEAIEEYFISSNVDSEKQIEYIKDNKMEFVKVILKNYTYNEGDYIFEAIGSKLGWLEINVKPIAITLLIILLTLAAVSENNNQELDFKSQIWLITLIAVIGILIKIVMYVTWSPVGGSNILGIQGRYYTPILFIIPMCLTRKNNYYNIKNSNTKLMFCTFLIVTYVIGIVIMKSL